VRPVLAGRIPVTGGEIPVTGGGIPVTGGGIPVTGGGIPEKVHNHGESGGQCAKSRNYSATVHTVSRFDPVA